MARDLSDVAKLLIAIVIDLIDFTFGRLFGLGLFIDVASAAIAFVLWGWPGLFALWELLDPSDQVDGFVPTMTFIAISQWGRRRAHPPRRDTRPPEATHTQAATEAAPRRPPVLPKTLR